jgi:hypothetical protein
VHTVFALKRWGVAPLLLNGNPRQALNQLLDGDLVYVGNFFDLTGWQDAELARFAHILHFCYGSFDVVYYVLRELMRRHVLAPDAPHRYLELTGLA